jgi:hypothetical protein
MKVSLISGGSLVVALALWPNLAGAECVTIGQPNGPTPPPKPPVTIGVSGAFCGTAFDPLGTFHDAALQLIDENRTVVAQTPTDSKGRFRFASVPIGRFRVDLPGFSPSAEFIEITSADQRACSRPLFVNMTVAGECTPPSHVTTTQPRR